MSATTPVVLRNANDTYVAERVPSSNFSGATYIVTRAGSGTHVYGLIYFARPFPLGATILSATLRLYQAGPETATHTAEIRKLTQGWSLSKVTWNNQPADTLTGRVMVTKPGSPSTTEWAFDVTSHMQTVSDGGPWYGWKILTNLDDYLNWFSAQAGNYKPVLEVTWANRPDAPTTLSPSGNRAVSLAKPVLRFDFTDVAGDTTLQAVQVQLNPTNTWTAPAFDSGTVATTDPELDLATTAYAGLAAGASTYWRVRVQDGAGLWSTWSAGHQFQRQTKGTLSIDNPPSSGLITEPTPPITWTFTGRTGTAYQVFVTPAGDNTNILYNTGKRAPWDNGITLPAGIIRDDSTYNLHLRVWDNIDRESTPGDTPWVYTYRTFTYDYDATIDPVTGLAVQDLTPKPHAKLTWSRATAPDSFTVRRDGVVIATGLDPADINTGSTTYTWTDRQADPRTNHTWRVDAIVNGRTSSPNPTVIAQIKPVGIWICDYERNVEVQLLGDDAGTWSMGEIAEIHTPVGASRPIRITQALRGFEGSISGSIMTYGGTTVAQAVANLYSIKERPGRTVQLTLADISIPVVLGNIVIAPTPIVETIRAVSLDFWQVGELPFRATL